jgi:L-glutamine---4-(methylsulfanyl)-2-oxobutanoate aminotransferase
VYFKYPIYGILIRWLPAKIIEASRKVHDFLTVGAAAPLQEAAITALQFDIIFINHKYFIFLLKINE